MTVLQRIYQEQFPQVEPLLNRYFHNAREAWDENRRTIPIDITANEEQVMVDASLPGVAQKDIEIAIDGRVLSIRAIVRTDNENCDNESYILRERSCGEFARKVHLPHGLDGAAAKSHYENGLLTITIPRSDESKPHKIKVE